MEFPTNLFISSKSSSKIFLAETEDTISKSVSETIYFSFLEIVQAVLLKVPSVLTFKSEIFFSTMSRVFAWEVLNFTFLSWLGKSIKGFSVLTKTDF